MFFFRDSQAKWIYTCLFICRLPPCACHMWGYHTRHCILWFILSFCALIRSKDIRRAVIFKPYWLKQGYRSNRTHVNLKLVNLKKKYLCKESNWNTYTLKLSIRGLWNRNPYKQGFKPNTRILQGKAFTVFSLEVHERQCSSLNKPWPFFPSRPQHSCSSLSSPVLSRNEGGIRGQESDEVKCYTNKLGFS